MTTERLSLFSRKPHDGRVLWKGGRPVGIVALLLLLVVACTPTATPRGTEAPAAGSAPTATTSQPSRTLVMAIRTEPATLTPKMMPGGVTLTTTRRLFNANLVIFDQRGQPQPYLAAEMPRLQTDSWQVFADGRMETTYKLKPDLVWQDGAPLTAEDFVFAWRVYATPEIGTAGLLPSISIDEAVAPDPLTLTIRWKRPYPQAGQLAEGFPPLPRHLMESAFQTSAPDAFLANAFWTQQYVGAGPFHVDRWEPGAFIEGSAFDRHVLGAPKISRVRIVFIGDPNAALANLLAGEVQFSADDSIRFEQGLTLQREWAPRNGGSILIKPDLWRSTYVQLRPDFLATPGLADVRVRRALAMAVDKEGLNQALFDGQGLFSDVPFVPSSVDYFAPIEAAATKYRYDPNQSQVQLAQAGYTRGADGVWASSSAGRLSFALTTTSSSQNESEMSILAAGWRLVGFEVNEAVFPVALAQDQQARTSFPGLFTISNPLGEDTLALFNTASTPRAENRWTGFNRGSWANPEFDRVSEMFASTLDQQQRTQLIAQMVRIYTEELPALPLFFNPIPLAHVAALKGPQNVAPASAIAWNVYQWELQ